jgi:hypothetical protein
MYARHNAGMHDEAPVRIFPHDGPAPDAGT